jgi:hypothetical protein
MASLKDAAQLTNEITELAGQLHAELTDGDVDFEKMVSLADQIGERCDSVASTFATFNDALTQTLQGGQGAGAEGGEGEDGSSEQQSSSEPAGSAGDSGESEGEESEAGEAGEQAEQPAEVRAGGS